ncbi:hypothetical protein, partial [Lacticaseibacillus rhamnosus]|uniref:hypothetical protein n=1 Tax=Lacticaseibacillus rhamnosus TaxID=47715 RepID=UPI001CDD19A3
MAGVWPIGFRGTYIHVSELVGAFRSPQHFQKAVHQIAPVVCKQTVPYLTTRTKTKPQNITTNAVTPKPNPA